MVKGYRRQMTKLRTRREPPPSRRRCLWVSPHRRRLSCCNAQRTIENTGTLMVHDDPHSSRIIPRSRPSAGTIAVLMRVWEMSVVVAIRVEQVLTGTACEHERRHLHCLHIFERAALEANGQCVA